MFYILRCVGWSVGSVDLLICFGGAECSMARAWGPTSLRWSLFMLFANPCPGLCRGNPFQGGGNGSRSPPPHILLFTTFPSRRTHEEPGSKSKNIPISEDTTSLVKELEAILRKLPTESIPSRDIYERNIGISWWGLDGFTWRNTESLGWGMSIPIRMVLTEEDKKAFDRAVEITEGLVGMGVARES